MDFINISSYSSIAPSIVHHKFAQSKDLFGYLKDKLGNYGHIIKSIIIVFRVIGKACVE